MDYHKEKLKKEFNELKAYYDSLYTNWESPTDWEDLYKIRIPMLVIAVLIRNKINKQIQIETLRNIKMNENNKLILYKEDEINSFIYPNTFRNKVKENISLDVFCDYLIHEVNSMFADNRKQFNQKDKFIIYYCVETDRKEERMFNINDFLNKIEKIIKEDN